MKALPLKKMPSLRSDSEAEDFVANSDLTEYDLSGFKKTTFEFQPKSETVNLRIPLELLNRVKNKAKEEGLPYTKYIRSILERAVS